MTLPHEVPSIFNLFLRALLESIFILTILYYCAKRTNIVEILRGIGIIPSCLYIFFIFFWFVAQMTDRYQYHFPQPYSTFPFVRFAMYQYGLPKDVVDSYQWRYTTVDRKEYDFNPTKSFSGIGLPSVTTRMETLLRKALLDGTDQHDLELTRWANSIRSYKLSEFTENKISKVSFYQVVKDRNKETIEEFLVWEYDF